MGTSTATLSVALECAKKSEPTLRDDLVNKGYHVWYRVHSQDYGWLGWAKDGDPAGTTGLAKRAEAVEVLIQSKDAAAPGSTDNALREG